MNDKSLPDYHFRSFAQMQTAHFTFVTSVRPHVSARILLEETPVNLILRTRKNLLKNPSKLVKIGQKYRAIYMKT